MAERYKKAGKQLQIGHLSTRNQAMLQRIGMTWNTDIKTSQ